MPECDECGEDAYVCPTCGCCWDCCDCDGGRTFDNDEMGYDPEERP